MDDDFFKEQAVRIYFEDLGQEVGNDFDASAYVGRVSFDKGLEELKDEFKEDEEFFKLIDKKFSEQQSEATQIIAKLDGEKNLVGLKDEMGSLFEANATADVDDAKYMVAQLREIGLGLIDGEGQDTVGQTEVQVLKDNIEPALMDIASDFETSVTALTDSVEEFDKGLQSNFQNVISSIQERINGLTEQIGEDEGDEWSVESGDDKLSRLKIIDENGVTTDIITFNDTNLTIVYKDSEEDDDAGLKSIKTDGVISLKGDGYDLNVTKLDIKDGASSLVASGEIVGENDSKMTLKELKLALDLKTDLLDDGPSSISENIEASFDGTIRSSGRELHGRLIVSENNTTTLDGKYTGTTGEPTLEGKISVNGSVNKFITDVEYNDEAYTHNNYSTTVEFNEGQTYKDSDGDLAYNGEKIIISDIEIKDKISVADRDFDLELKGKLIHGTKIIDLSVGVDNKLRDTKIYAKDITITDGSSKVGLKELSLVVPRADFVEVVDGDKDDDYYHLNSDYGHSTFENYTISYYDEYDNNDEKPEFHAINLDDLNITIVDSDGESLNVFADVNYNLSPMGEEKISLLGKYSYGDTKFVGTIEANGELTQPNEYNENSENDLVGSFNISGEIESNNFRPFSITAAGFIAPYDLNVSALLTRELEDGNEYKVGVNVANHYDDINDTDYNYIKIADSNGVKIDEENVNYHSHDENDDISKSIIITDKDGNSLATFGEEENGNSWEIKYSDDTSETLF